MVTPFVSALESLGLEENIVGFYRNLSKNILALSLLQAAKQVFSTYSASTRSDLNPYITISKMEFTLPAIVDTLLKAIGNFKTKNGSAKIRFPNATMKGFLYNASYIYVLEKYGDDDSIDESKIKPSFYFHESESLEKLKYHIKGYFDTTNSSLLGTPTIACPLPDLVTPRLLLI